MMTSIAGGLNTGIWLCAVVLGAAGSAIIVTVAASLLCAGVKCMDRICEALDCDVSDLLERVPSRQRKTGKDLILEQHGNRKTKQ